MAAIMFTDMAGYTALGQRNESLSLALVEEQRKLIRPVLIRHDGREVKTMGDAFLVEFPNVLDAVRCAYDIQRATREFNISLPQEQRVHLRIGVHLGDVVEAEGDISGDAVNVASRIESFAEDGGVCLTRQVYDHVQNKFQLPITSLGTKHLKNVNMPVEVYKMSMPWEPSAVQDETASATPINRLAVLPFANMSPDPNDEFFADGLTEEMITELSGLSGVGVIARTSVMHYKNSQKGVREIANDLKVGSVLEGSIRKAGNKIRITAQLIDGRNEEHLWAQRFDRDLNDIFAVQSEIAESVAKALKLKLVPRGELIKPSQENLDVYALCLQARSLWSKRTKEGIEQAILLFQKAMSLDPDSARVNAGLADCYWMAADRNYMGAEEGQMEVRKFVKRALELDPSSPDAHATLGLILGDQQKWDDAEKEFRTAISLNPNYASAHQWYGFHLMVVGRFTEGLNEFIKAADLDPLSPIINGNLSSAFFWAGRIDDALSIVNKIIELDPGFPFAYGARAWHHAIKGLRNEALADVEMFHKLTKNELVYKLQRAECEALLGNRDEAIRLIKDVEPLSETSQDPRDSPIWVYAIIKDNDSFFKWANWFIERKIMNPIIGLVPSLRYSPIFDSARKDLRYHEFLRKLNLSP